MKNNNAISNLSLDVALLNVLSEILETLKAFPPAVSADTEYFDSSDVKKFLNISDSTLNRMRKERKIPFIRFGHKLFYPKSFFTDAMKRENNRT